MFWVLVASQLSLPVAVGVRVPDVRAVFSPDDMPAYVQIDGINRFVSTRTTVNSDGKTQDCTAERGSGDPKLDALTCAIILKRAKFQPAKWVDGSPAYSVLRAPVSWTIGGPATESELQRAYPADMELSVNQLPSGARPRTKLSLMLAVDVNGAVVDCGQMPPVSKYAPATAFPQLVSVACQQMVGHFRAIPARDPSGKPVHSVQTATVVFSVGG